MSSPSTSSSHSGDESDSSSVVYDHEPFITFRSRVLALATSSIWPDAAPEEVTVERLQGGGFNRIIGLAQQKSNTKTQYILRIPRFNAAQVNNDVAVLRFLQQYTTIPAPEVVTFDETEHNALGSPYAVQNRIPGVDLYSTYPNLRHEERHKVARELGAIFNQMLAVRSSTAGKLVLPTDRKSLEVPVHVAPLTDMVSEPARPYNASAPSESTHDLLTNIFLSRKAYEQKRNPSDTVGPKLWDQFCQMTSELNAGGWLADGHYSITHLDLAPRNILVNPTADPRLPIISGVLDWDSAVLGPRFMSCAPPLWLWAWQDDEDEDERTANDVPPTPEGRQLKTSFEEAAGQDYVRFAYEPAYRLGRRLVRFATDGLRSNEDFKESEAMLEEWNGYYQPGNQEN
ncbi:hypothetical protein ACHAPT_005780 [Fusarium lateritium]